MKQSERIKWYLSYNNHPLKNEYLKEKSKIKYRRISGFQKLIIALCTIPFILIFVIGYLFFESVYIINGLGGLGHTLLYIAAGIGNLILCLYIFFAAFEYGLGWEKTDEFEKLQKKYREKGLLEVDDPFLSECSEYDNMLEERVCSVTREPLSNREIEWCQTRGNCRKCARFVNAMGIDVNDWSKYHEIEKW